MGPMYSAVFEEVVVAAAQDLFEINAPSNGVVILHGFELGQSSDTDSEMLNILVHRGTTSGSGGSSVTARPMEVGAPAFGGTIEVNNTSQSTEGVHLHSGCFNVVNGYLCVWTPKEQPAISPSGRLIIELQTTPADALTMSGTVYFEVIGG